MAFPWAAAASGASGISGPIISGLMNQKANRENRDYNNQLTYQDRIWNLGMWNMENEYAEKVWNMQNQYNEEMWQRMNDYNSPASQMARFSQAGLNPNLIYGQMSNVGGWDSSQVKQSDIGRSSGTPSQPNRWDFGDFGGQAFANAYNQSLMTEAQTNNLAAQTKVAQAEEAVKQATADGIVLDNLNKDTRNKSDAYRFQQDLKYSADARANEVKLQESQLKVNDAALRKMSQDMDIGLKDYQLRAAQSAATIREALIRMEVLEADKINKTFDSQLKLLDLQLREKGINNSDWIWWRNLFNIVEDVKRANKDPRQFIQNSKW